MRRCSYSFPSCPDASAAFLIQPSLSILPAQRMICRRDLWQHYKVPSFPGADDAAHELGYKDVDCRCHLQPVSSVQWSPRRARTLHRSPSRSSSAPLNFLSAVYLGSERSWHLFSKLFVSIPSRRTHYALSTLLTSPCSSSVPSSSSLSSPSPSWRRVRTHRLITWIRSLTNTRTVRAVVWPLSRYMLDVIPEGEGDVHINPASAASQGAAGSLVGHTDVPAASETSAVDEGQSDAVESSAVPSASTVDSSPPAAVSRICLSAEQ